jgi:hypothetical protein
MPRFPRLDAPGVLYHVMGRGSERWKIFFNIKDRNDFIARVIGSSSPKELPLQALTEPDMNLSVHPALIIQPLTINRTSAQIIAFDSF